VLACCAAGPSGRLAAQQVNLNEWLNQRIDSAVAARLATRDGAKQAAVPVASGSDASLVDRAAMPDVVGISLTLPDAPASGSVPSTTALSLSGTAYGLWAFLKGAGLTDTRFYLASKAARRIGISAAFDTNDSLGTTGLVQVKALVLDRGNPLTGAQGIGSALGKAGRAFGALKEGVQDLLFERVGKPRGQELPDFVDALAQPEVFANVLAAAGPEGLALIDRAILRSVAAFEGLRQQVGSAVAAARSRPELALGLTAQTSGTFADQLRLLLIFDYQARSSLDFTVNAGYEHVRARGLITERTRFQLASQLLFRLTPDTHLEGRGPVSLTVGSSVAIDTRDGRRNVAKLQARLLIPIGEGINVPVSATWANRTDLIDEARVKGQVGCTIDLGQILAAAL
jgi:hypothetical protein